MSVLALSLLPGRGETEGDFCPIVVGKALLNPPPRPARQINSSQKALASFLARKHERFLARRKRGLDGQLGGGSSLDVSLEESGGALSASDGTTWNKSATWNGSATSLRARDEKDTVLDKCAFRIASLDLDAAKHRNHPQGTQKAYNKQNPDDLVKLNCEELAEKVVCRVKTRLRHCSRRRRSGADVSHNRVDKPLSEVVEIVRSSTPVPSLSNTSTPLSLSPLKKDHTRPRNPSLNRSFEEPSSLSTSGLRVAKKIICFSEKQSVTCKDTGVPNVPPSTPRTVLQNGVKYVLSLSDIKSQRDLKYQLQAIASANQEMANKEMQLEVEREKKRKKEETVKLKAQQRAEIYALNKVMAEFENQKFEAFMSGKV